MKTIEFTEHQLLVELLEIKGWKCEMCGKTAREHFYKSEPPKEFPEMDFGTLFDNPYFHGCKDYKNPERDMAPWYIEEIADAWTLLAELPSWISWSISYHARALIRLCGARPDGEWVEVQVNVPTQDKIPLAISAAVYELETGVKVVMAMPEG